MTTRFECRYTHDWAYTKDVYMLSLKSTPHFILWWCGLAAFTLIMALYQFFIRHSTTFGTIFLVLIPVVLWRGFGGIVRVRRRWTQTCQRMGSDHIETSFLFGSSVRIRDDSGTTAEMAWDAFEQAYKLQEMGPYLKLEVRGTDPRQKGNLYLPRTGFEDGTGEAFLSWIGQKHPALLH